MGVGVLVGVVVLLTVMLGVALGDTRGGQTHPPPVKVPVPPSKETGKLVALQIQISVPVVKKSDLSIP